MSTRNDWIRAAADALADGGVEAVRVEALARTMHVTKGSFYWHFADRAALLEAVLSAWESASAESLAAAEELGSPGQRIAALFRDLARPTAGLPDPEVRAWARRERAVAERVAEVERRRVVFLKEQLAEQGASLQDAHRRAEAGYLAAIAWIERASRTTWMKSDYGAFIQDVFRLLLRTAAS